jgi:DNA polymerase III delta prime subunit
MNEEFIWAQRYRPKTIDECILPVRMKETFKGYVAKGQIANMTLNGVRGTGKTTCAFALCHEIGADVLFINASSDTGVDIIRDKVLRFASTGSLENNLKVVILDEVDRGSGQFQDALKSLIETFSHNCRFILTSNHVSKITPELLSRCPPIEFKIPKDEVQKLAVALLHRLEFILSENNIEYSKGAVISLIQQHFPDNRKIINILQNYSVSGKIDVGVLASMTDGMLMELIENIKGKKFEACRKWVADNTDVDPSALFNMLYKKLTPLVIENSIAEMIIILAKYGAQSTMGVDQEINTAAAVLELMISIKFK